MRGMKEHFLTLARASRWANALLQAELERLSPAQWAQEVPALNFGSIRGIANHLLLADRAWLFRFTGEGESPERIDVAPCADALGLGAARRAEDARALAFVEGLDGERLAGTLHYFSMKGAPCAEPLALCLAHFFNHQTHHRGQLHALLGVHGVAAPDLDLIYFLSAQRKGLA